ncbi:hypothetical protein LZ24_02528 [Desulfobotulus alkaliphilus]|uniref:Uncharacterized protein n=1 Tax=Desulfobotulus alkaliphilus TaxID=622671 RepID=A0A562RHK4_9BACT|nr:hypothetical protein [Desulfobotulus alkaliphilus]TWI68555.1 hypothetical protein LZ24_02528 [Desulfobotulus alkaliphilus]
MMDVQAFLRASFRPRTRRLPAPQELHGFFGNPAEAVFEVRGLSGEELARVRSAVERNRDLGQLVEKLFGDQEDKLDAIRTLAGVNPDTLPDDLARRMALVCEGCTAPAFDEQATVKLFQVQPVFAYQLADTVLNLTGEGASLGE